VAKVSVEFKRMKMDDETKQSVLRKLSEKIKEATQVTMAVEEVPYGTIPGSNTR